VNADGLSQKVGEYRAEAMKKLLKKYTRHFTFMELWAEEGDLTFAIASKYNAACIMTEFDNADTLLSLCKKNADINNVVLLKEDLTVDDLVRFGECEHIDVTFFPDLSQRFEEWKEAIDAALTFGDYTVIEAPSKKSGLQDKVEQYMKEKGGELLARPQGELADVAGAIYQFTVNKKYLIRRRWNYNKDQKIGEYTIKSSFSEKKLIKEKKRPAGYAVTDWSAGINLFTFKKLHGLYPAKETIRKMLIPLSTIKHNDLRIFNLIIQGEKLIPIDIDENGRVHTAKELLPFILSQFRYRNLSLIQAYESEDGYLEAVDLAINNPEE
jgi:hypothetical protein